MKRKAPKPKPMVEVARLLRDMAETIEVCDRTLKYMDKAIQKQQPKPKP